MLLLQLFLFLKVAIAILIATAMAWHVTVAVAIASGHPRPIGFEFSDALFWTNHGVGFLLLTLLLDMFLSVLSLLLQVLTVTNMQVALF